MSDESFASPRILIVEDDESIKLGLRMNLENEGYEVATAEDGESGLCRISDELWDLVILDIMLPKLNGYELLTELRKREIDVPVLVLSARTTDWDKVMGLDMGAEDYVTKPFSVPELMARVRAALRRQLARGSVVFGDVAIDSALREVTRAGEKVDLTATEYNVLWALVRARGRPLSRSQIFNAVWGPSHHGTHRTIDNFVAQLRNKLEVDPAEPRHLVTVRGVGYRLAL
jgi:DNA-binding response OmpR family regulator